MMFAKNSIVTACVLGIVTYGIYAVAAEHNSQVQGSSAEAGAASQSVGERATARVDARPAERDASRQYIYIIEPARKTLAQDASDEESRVVEAHFEYLKSLLADGRLILAGRTQDENTPVGIVIFEADSDAHAAEVFKHDPAVEAGIFVGTVRPYRIALQRGS